jgi:hypothetical protein
MAIAGWGMEAFGSDTASAEHLTLACEGVRRWRIGQAERKFRGPPKADLRLLY